MAEGKAIEEAIAHIEQAFGKGAIMRLGEKPALDVDVIPTGAIGLDIALGVGGLPRGRIVELYGPEASGKSTLALHVVAEAQRMGGVAAYIDAEHALDPQYAEAIGVAVNDLLISQPDTGEQALEIANILVKEHAVDVVVIDSVAALVPRVEIEGSMGDAHVGLQARLMSQALRILTASVSRSGAVALFINQLREKIGVTYGSPEVTPGGKALKFYSSIRLDIRRVEALKSGPDIIGNRTRVKVAKNKCAPPFRQADLDIIWGVGISREGSILDVATDLGLVKRSGAWFSWHDEQLGHGREAVKARLMSDPALASALEAEIRDKMSAGASRAEDVKEDQDLLPEDDLPL